MSDPLIENFEIGLYEQYLEDLEKKLEAYEQRKN